MGTSQRRCLLGHILLLSTMARLVLYTRLVSDIQSEPLFPPGSRAAQRRETPENASKKNGNGGFLCGSDGLGRSVLTSSDADGRAWAKAAAGTVGRRVGVERHRAVTFTTLRASARRTGQTAYLRAAFGRVKMAHPDLLFNSLRRNRVSMSRWVVWHWLSHPRRRGSTILRHAVRWHHTIGWTHTVWRVPARR